jgi:fumarylpyruvate hydrolase
MSTEYVIPAWDVPSLPVVGSKARFPVRRIFCVGRNYVEHQKEMGSDGREEPFFFCKAPQGLVAVEEGETKAIHYGLMTQNYHWETEMVAVLSKGGYKVKAADANSLIWGYAIGQDMTRRDLQISHREKKRPWDFGKDFDESAVVGPVHPASKVGHPSKGALWLNVNGEKKQSADISDMIWNIPEQIEYLSQYYVLEPGDIIMTGTPAGVGACKPGDNFVAGIEGLGEIKLTVRARG